jgi:transcriptional regulator with XRE-family HTH domain
LTGSRQSLRAVPAESFGSRLRRQRRIDDLTQSELGERFGVRQQTIGAWERGERPQSRFLGELASYLGFEGGQELVSLIESQAGMPVTLEALSADADRTPTTDGDTMRLLAWSFVQDRQAGSLPPEQADIYREFIEYFRVRAIDI